LPILCTFLGIIIKVFHHDHNPPHIHVEYAEFKALVEIKTGKIISGKLPPRAFRALNEWRKIHLKEIHRAWLTAQSGRMPKKIKPLE